MHTKKKGKGIIIRWYKEVLFISIPFLIVMAPVLFGFQVYSFSDTLDLHYPSYFFYKEAITTGQNFLWNPYVLSGFPTYASASSFFSPVHYIAFKFLNVLTAYHWLLFFYSALGAFFTYKFLRILKLSFWASYLGGMTFIFSQWYWASTLGIVIMWLILPLFFIIIGRLDKSRFYVLWGGLVLGYAWISAHPNWIIMMLISAGFYVVYRILEEYKYSKGVNRSIILRFIGVLIIGTAIGFVQIYPILLYSGLSARNAGLRYSEASAGSLNIGDIVKFIFPYADLPFISGQSQVYMGILPLIFVVSALFVRVSIARFFSFLCIFALAAAVKFSPLFWIMNKLPILDNFREPWRWMYIGLFAGSVLTAFGLDYTRKNKSINIYLVKGLKYLIVFTLTVSIAFTAFFKLFKERLLKILFGYFDSNYFSSTSGLPIDHYHRVIADMFSKIESFFDLTNIYFLIPLFFIIVSYIIIDFYNHKWIIPDNFVKLAVLMALLNLLAVYFNFIPTIKAETYLNMPKTSELIQKKQGKVFSFLPGFSEYSKLTVPYDPDYHESYVFKSETLSPNMNIPYSIKSADGYENMMNRRMARILALIGSDRSTYGDKLSDEKIPPDKKVKLFGGRKDLLDVLGVKYIVSIFPLPEADFGKIYSFEIPPYNVSAAVYKNKDARPEFYFADQIYFIKPGEQAAYENMLSHNFIGNSVIMECSSCPEDINTDSRGSITVKEDTNGKAVIETDIPSNKLLVFNENNIPGWRAYIDKQEVKIFYINSVFQGIVIPSGSHTISFVYEYPLSMIQQLFNAGKSSLNNSAE